MGTKALIFRNGKKWVFTHWDGYPDALGILLCELKRSGKTERQKLKILHKYHKVDRYYNYHGMEAVILTDRRKPLKKLKFEIFRPNKNTDWFFSYAYNIKRSGIFYTKSLGTENVLKSDIEKINWKKFC